MYTNASRLTEEELRIIEATGWGARQGFGTRPAVIVIDVTYGFTGDKPEPILKSIERFPTSCGEHAWESVRAIKELLVEARSAAVPVFYTRNDFHPLKLDLGSWRWKSARVDEGAREYERLARQIVADIGPTERDIVITKQKPSAFFGTPLLSNLIELGVDQLVVVGCVTSGCVRSSVIDAFSNNLRVAVVREGTFDRIELSHEVALFEMDAKYADVHSLESAIAYLRTMREGVQVAV